MNSAPWGDTPRRAYNLPFQNDCDATASYAQGMLLGGYPEPSYGDAATFFKAMFPGENLSSDTIIEYHDYFWQPNFDLYRFEEGFAPCQRQLCAATTAHVDNTGMGVGMLVSLGLEADSPSLPVHRVRPRHLRLYGSTRHFFICAIILCLGSSIGLLADAVHNSHVESLGEVGGRVRPYGHQLLAVAITYFSLAATVPAYLWGSRRQWLDAPLLVFTWLLSAIAIIINNLGSSGSRQTSFSRICPDDFIPSGVLMACLFFTHGVGAWCPALFALMWAKPTIRRGLRALILLYAVLGFLAVWAFLLILYIFVSKTSWIKANVFDLGQGLAVALWIPLIYEVVHSAIVGIDRGLTAGLPREYVAIREGEINDDVDDDPVFVPGMAPGPRGALRAPVAPPGGYYSAGSVPGTALGMTPNRRRR
ncbi:unnamed protein product [Parascedosporium putredinis]|uniref:Uncharacterized protein n=1 Tax=Parascedosporium putredinis TaxID=1442378 RepID=A0A9P1M9R3_9PEZI|nr:unnamed protein product [Parascedosporium putredinis]CAI7996093.1 unnamed protein product [Parascedosporium putredinis]